MSNTLKLVMKHWHGPLFDENFTDLPFNIENFCRENDAMIEKLREQRNKYITAFLQLHDKTMRPSALFEIADAEVAALESENK